MIYAAELHHEDPPAGGYWVSFRDVPEALTQGETVEEALRQAEDALITALSAYPDMGKTFPQPSAPKRGEHLVVVPALDQAKLVLIARMAELKISKADLAKRLGVNETVTRRLTNFNHRSKIDNVEAALKELGRSLEVRPRVDA